MYYSYRASIAKMEEGWPSWKGLAKLEGPILLGYNCIN